MECGCVVAAVGPLWRCRLDLPWSARVGGDTVTAAGIPVPLWLALVILVVLIPAVFIRSRIEESSEADRKHLYREMRKQIEEEPDG